MVIPASSEVLRDALAAGYVDTFIDAGAMLGVPGCGPCMGNHLGIPASGETVISTANRNFRGRMGNRDADIYLASPQVVAASAVLGRIASSEDLAGFERHRVAHPSGPAAGERS
jgi:3-isopropylmalate/(R)-2-methylmalate dehydratase large subunit